MTIETVAVLSPGDMGHAVGRALGDAGLRIITCLTGRSTRSRKLAEAAGFADLPSLEAMIGEADLVLSILPPAAAVDTAERVAAAMKAAGRTRFFADCNAISPMTTRRIAAVMAAAEAPYIDAGIIGPPPGRGTQPTRFYVSGPHVEIFDALDGPTISVRPLGPEIGRASAMKMCYAAITKGSWTLYAAALTTAEALGLRDVYLDEVTSSRPHVAAEMRRMVPRLPVDAGRWIGEMAEIEATLGAVGLPRGFHHGAAEMFRLLDRTPIAAETRETFDDSRTLEQALAMFVACLPGGGAAGAGGSGDSGHVTLVATPLDADAFAPFGEIFALGAGSPGTRDEFIAAMDNGRGAAARLNVSVIRHAPTPLPLTVRWMERHPHSGQSFVPLDASRYLALVAPSGADGGPDLGRARAFLVDGRTGINYRAGTWHHPFTALDRSSECLMLRFDDGTEADTEWHEVADGPVVGETPAK